jgi:histidinol-phosphate aminotransferase
MKPSQSPERLVRASVKRLHAYTPGEQPKIRGLIKLNTNENPYPPAPAVLRQVKAAVDGRLRLYPNPTAQMLREKLAKFHSCAPENIIVGNGSDEVLALATRAFIEPAAQGVKPDASLLQYFTPSYSLYPVLGGIHGALNHPVPLEPNFDWPKKLSRTGWNFNAALSLITTPNAPSGRGYSTTALSEICARQKGVVVLDEAYVDFARENAMKLAFEYSNVLVARTFSKAYSLCFQRVGYFVGHPVLIDALQKLRDSYNVNGLGQAAAAATLDNLPYYRQNFRRIVQSRKMLTAELVSLGFEVLPSETNFLLVTPPKVEAKIWLGLLREEKILVRWFSDPSVNRHLRITIGSEKEMKALLRATRRILKGL